MTPMSQVAAFSTGSVAVHRGPFLQLGLLELLPRTLRRIRRRIFPQLDNRSCLSM